MRLAVLLVLALTACAPGTAGLEPITTRPDWPLEGSR